MAFLSRMYRAAYPQQPKAAFYRNRLVANKDGVKPETFPQFTRQNSHQPSSQMVWEDDRSIRRGAPVCWPVRW